MLKKMTTVITLVLGISLGVSAQTSDTSGDQNPEPGHSATVCTVQNPQICAHLGHMSTINTKEEGQFVAHIMTPNNVEMSNVHIDLWMASMGHGSAPLDVTRIDVNKYQVKNAWFMMSGPWLVRLKFKDSVQSYEIDIPLEVPSMF